ncbi:MAG: hypothetical protein MJZ20_10960 [Bacteroidaceae bacterium]|nr:hypothetical protein [Bacteroidaceae bacterium]
MEIETVFEGVHPDGIKFRVREINGMFYYAVQIPDDYGIGWIWHTVARNPSKKVIVDRVIADRQAKQRRKRRMVERG